MVEALLSKGAAAVLGPRKRLSGKWAIRKSPSCKGRRSELHLEEKSSVSKLTKPSGRGLLHSKNGTGEGKGLPRREMCGLRKKMGLPKEGEAPAGGQKGFKEPLSINFEVGGALFPRGRVPKKSTSRGNAYSREKKKL